MFETINNFAEKHPMIICGLACAMIGAIKEIALVKRNRSKKADTKKTRDEINGLMDRATKDFKDSSDAVEDLMRKWSENLDNKAEAEEICEKKGYLYSPDELTPHRAIMFWMEQEEYMRLTFMQILLARVYPDKFKDDYKKEAEELYEDLNAYDKYVVDIVIDAHYDILKGVM